MDEREENLTRLVEEFTGKAKESGCEVWQWEGKDTWGKIPELHRNNWWWDTEEVIPYLPEGVEERRAEAKEAAVGITLAHLGIAQTGTAVLSGKHKIASLLPPVHICLIPTWRIIPTLAEGLQMVKELAGKESVVLITGPSRTADIEQTLVLGVHGPLRVIILLIPR